MKKIATLAVLAATALTATATASAAQPYGYGPPAWEPINPRQAQIERRIERGLMRGTITRAEARRLHHELNRLARLEARYRFNGLSYAERADLDWRLDRLAAMVRFENRDHDREYGYGYGYGYDYGRRW